MLKWLRGYEQLSSAGDFSIAIGEPRDGQRHVGVNFRAGDGEVRFLHLAFHRDLRCDPPKPAYRWVSPAGVDPSYQAFLAALCRRLAQSPPQLPYGFGVGRFDVDSGQFVQRGVARGLTCATFVLAILSAYEIELVDVASWKSRADDHTWQLAILQAIDQAANGGGESDHVAAIRRDAGNCVRIRPEEVAGAASCSRLPVAYPAAKSLGEAVLRVLQASLGG